MPFTGPLTSYTPNIGDSRKSTLNYPTCTPVTEATAAAVTYTVAEILGGFLIRSTAGASRADLLPTVAALVAAINGPFVGLSFDFVIRNNASAAETITVTTNTGWTLSGTMTIAQNASKLFRVVFTNVVAGTEAATLYSIGTFVH